MRNCLFFPLMAVIAAAMIALALNWPEGEAGQGPAPVDAPLAASQASPQAAPQDAPQADDAP